MRSIDEVASDMALRYDAYNDIHKMLTNAGWEMTSEWDGSISVGGSFKKDWETVRVDTYWDDDRIRLVFNNELVYTTDWDYDWQEDIEAILDVRMS